MRTSVLSQPQADNTSFDMSPVTVLDEGQIARPDAIPLNRGPVARTFDGLPDTDNDNAFSRTAWDMGLLPAPMDRYDHSQIFRPVEESDLGSRVEMSNDLHDWHSRTLDKIKLRQGNQGYHKFACFTRCESRQTVDADGNPTTEPPKFKHWQYARVYVGKSPTVEPQAEQEQTTTESVDPLFVERVEMSGDEVLALVESHGRWLQDGDGERIDLSNRHITEADLSGIDLSLAYANGTEFADCILRGVNFGGADLERTAFIRCDCEGASFSSSSLISGGFSGCVLTGTNIGDAILLDANFRDEDLAGAILKDAKISGACFDGAILKGALGLPPVMSMPNLAGMLHTGLTLDPQKINVAYGHFPDRLNIDEWVVMLHPQGELLESLLSSRTAAALIWNASYGVVPSFNENHKKHTLEWLRERAFCKLRYRVVQLDGGGNVVKEIFDTDWLPTAEEMASEISGDGEPAGIVCTKTGCRIVEGKLRTDLPGCKVPMASWIQASQL